MSLKSRLDFKSIRFKLWLYFIGFSLLLISIIWFLQIFFLNHYYEQMKISEVTKMADEIVETFDSSGDDFLTLSDTLEAICTENDDVYILSLIHI